MLSGQIELSCELNYADEPLSSATSLWPRRSVLEDTSFDHATQHVLNNVLQSVSGQFHVICPRLFRRMSTVALALRPKKVRSILSRRYASWEPLALTCRV